jgi:hypothetical protein
MNERVLFLADARQDRFLRAVEDDTSKLMSLVMSKRKHDTTTRRL